MATIHFGTRQITAKVVYCGAAGAGSNTSVQKLYDLVPPRSRSRLHKFGVGGNEGRSWYFDHVAPDVSVAGFELVVQVCSLPGSLSQPAHREVVLKDADAMVFVADARRDRAPANIDAILELEADLQRYGLELSAMPVVIQVNHSDEPDAGPTAEVVSDLNPYGFPVVATSAREGEGILETQREIIQSTAARIRDNLAGNEAAITLTAVNRPEADRDDAVVARHVEAIRASHAEAPSAMAAYDDLPAGPHVDVPCQPDSLSGARPVHVLGASIEGDRVVVELVLERATDDLHRLRVCLLPQRLGTATPQRERERSVGDYLPRTIETAKPRPSVDLPGWLYGVLGIGGGLVIGVLLGYLGGLF